MRLEAFFFRPRLLIWNRLAFSPTLKKRNSSGPQGKVEAEIYFIKRVDKGRMATVKDLES